MAHEQSEAELVWGKILIELENKLQMGFLNQAKLVRSVALEGEELTLFLEEHDALEFFQAEVNQQRLLLFSRGVIRLERIRAKKFEESDKPG